MTGLSWLEGSAFQSTDTNRTASVQPFLSCKGSSLYKFHNITAPLRNSLKEEFT